MHLSVKIATVYVSMDGGVYGLGSTRDAENRSETEGSAKRRLK